MPDPSPYTLRAALRRQIVLVIALIGVLGIIAVAATGRVPLAGTLLAVELVALALVRALAPTESVGGLAVRSRLLDVSGLLALAIGLGILVTTPNL